MNARTAARELVAAHNRELQLRGRIQELESQIATWQRGAVQLARSPTETRLVELLTEIRGLVEALREDRAQPRPAADPHATAPLVGLPSREVVTVREVCRAFNVSRRTVDYWIATGRVTLAGTPGIRRIVRRSLLKEAS